MDVVVSSDGRRIYSIDTAGVVRNLAIHQSAGGHASPGSFPNLNRFEVNADASVIVSIRSRELTTIRLSDLQQETIQNIGARRRPPA
jgi:hypothetical protein